MIELKAHRIIGFDGEYNRVDNVYYLKSDADKVIAEKDKEIQRLENLCESYRIDCDNLAIREANAYKEIERDNKRIRHQKHKRCFAMAKWCEEQYKYLTCLENWQMTDKEYQQVIGDYWDRWHKHWLKIAEQFKDKETK